MSNIAIDLSLNPVLLRLVLFRSLAALCWDEEVAKVAAMAKLA